MSEDNKSLHVLLLAPFYADSHRSWADGLIAHSRHQFTLLSLPGRHWKWRMHGAAVTFAHRIKALETIPQVIITTDMLDVTTLKALLPVSWQKIPIWIYMHENQLTYPWSYDDIDPTLRRDRHYAWINYTSCLSADSISFNSKYHRDSFLNALPGFLQAFPDYTEFQLVEKIADKSDVCYLGMDMPSDLPNKVVLDRPHLLWNHRWEYDKNPDTFFNTLMKLSAEGVVFDLSVVGRSYGRQPKIFAVAKERLAKHIVHWGYMKDKSQYHSILQSANILPVTSNQDFFGISVVEALRYGLTPLLPNRLAYRDYVDPKECSHLYYNDDVAFYHSLKSWCEQWPRSYKDISHLVTGFVWSEIISKYDNKITSVSSY